METFDPVLILVTSFFAALLFCSFGNFFMPKYLKKKIFSKEWWYFVLFMTVIFILLFVFSFLFNTDNSSVSTTKISSPNFLTYIMIMGAIIIISAFYINYKVLKKWLYILGGLTIFTVNIYCLSFLKLVNLQIIGGLLFSILILVFGPTGKLDKIFEFYKQKKSDKDSPLRSESGPCGKKQKKQ